MKEGLDSFCRPQLSDQIAAVVVPPTDSSRRHRIPMPFLFSKPQGGNESSSQKITDGFFLEKKAFLAVLERKIAGAGASANHGSPKDAVWCDGQKREIQRARKSEEERQRKCMNSRVKITSTRPIF